MPMLAAVSLLSAAAVAYEILLTRLFAIALWHHFAYMIISLALLGYGASGTLLVFVKRRLLARFGASFTALAVSFGVAAIGCYEGLQVSGSAESVGQLTTRSVVEAIFCVIVLDALFSIIFLLADV